jgi:hypothetical protein
VSNRLNWFYDQEVTEQELDLAFDYMETADHNMMRDLGFRGVFEGNFGVAPTIPPSFNVRVSGMYNPGPYDPNLPPGIGISKTGKRLYGDVPADVNCLVDEDSQAISMPAPGNEKYVSIFVAHTYGESDPRQDGNNQTVNFKKTETVKYNVVGGQEAALGTATRPLTRSDELLIADVKLTNGLASIDTAQIFTTRTEVITKPDVGANIQAGELLLGRFALKENFGLHTVVPKSKATSESLTKAWVKFNATGVYENGYNISEVVRTGVGTYVVTTFDNLFGVAKEELAAYANTGWRPQIANEMVAHISFVNVVSGAALVYITTRSSISNLLYDCDVSMSILHKESP